MDQYKKDFFDGFRSGQNFAWIVSKKDKNEPSKISTIVRKVDEDKLSLPVWIKKSDAEKFISEMNCLEEYSLRCININELKVAISEFEYLQKIILIDLI